MRGATACTSAGYVTKNFASPIHLRQQMVNGDSPALRTQDRVQPRSPTGKPPAIDEFDDALTHWTSPRKNSAHRKERMFMSSKKPATNRWGKGTSGNPTGRPVGSRNKSTLFLEEVLDGESEAVIRKAIELALKGESTAMRLCMERIYPARKDRLVELCLPKITEPQQASAATASILEAVAQGCITPEEAELLARTVQIHVQIIETQDLARRVAELEKRIDDPEGPRIEHRDKTEPESRPEAAAKGTEPVAKTSNGVASGTTNGAGTGSPETSTGPVTTKLGETVGNPPGARAGSTETGTDPKISERNSHEA